jgi:hypothetical protein
MHKTLLAISSLGLLAACASNRDQYPAPPAPSPYVQSKAVQGAAMGALAGAAFGAASRDVDVKTGAIVGAAIGGTAAAVLACREEGGCGAAPSGRRQYYDEPAGRYYFWDPARGRYYWENGSPR